MQKYSSFLQNDLVYYIFSKLAYQLCVDLTTFSKKVILTSANQGFLLFQFGFQWLIMLAKISSVILNEGSKSGHPCLVAFVKWNSMSFIKYEISCNILIVPSIRLRKLPSTHLEEFV